MRIGVEIGGTFTDLVLLDEAGDVRTVKVPSTPSSPEVGALRAVGQAVPGLESTETIVHGSTIATNGVLERKGARVGLLLTRGFRDLLELQRQDRTNTYQLKYVGPRPLVACEDVREIDERTRADGEVLRAPRPEQVRDATRELLESGVTSIAVCLLHAYRFPAHELQVREAIEAAWPELLVTLSHEIVPEYREYERASTTVLSSYVRPIIDAYLGRLEAGLREQRFAGDLHVMQSNGGTLPAALIRRHAVRTLLSGPAGGVTAAKAVAARLDIRDVITFDMGGTSTDVCLIEDLQADVTAESQVDRLPIRVPMLDIVTVGAGGGSIARVDAGGLLRVGPQSAGAHPGPACYGRGGTNATVTDANVVLGLVRPDRFLGGRMKLDGRAAHVACADLGRALGTDAIGAARAIVRVANATMQGALRLVSTERGVDPRRFWLLCYGGAGGQHAAALAEELGLRGVIVPRYPGLFSAYGLLIADVQRDWSAPFLRSTAELAPEELPALTDALRAAARDELGGVGLATERIAYRSSLEMRYPGQAFEVDVAVPDEALGSGATIAALFHAAHRQRYGHAAEHIVPEIVTVRVTASIPQPTSTVPRRRPTARPEVEQVELEVEGSRRAVAFVQRDALPEDYVVRGPAVIEEETSTVWVPPGWAGRADPYGHLHLERSA